MLKWLKIWERNGLKRRWHNGDEMECCSGSKLESHTLVWEKNKHMIGLYFLNQYQTI